MKRWWAVYFLSGAATMGVHLRLGSLAGPRDTGTVLAHFGVAFLVYLLGLVSVRRLGRGRRWLMVLWGLAVGSVSLAGYWQSDLLLTSEVQRYRWDGRVAEAGYNPYEMTPSSGELDALRERFPDPVPGPERKGFYPPLSELAFYLLARLDLDSVLVYRISLSVLTLLAGLALYALAGEARVPRSRVIVFLWHPLVILETGAHAHIDILGILFLLVSLVLLVRRHELSPLGFLGLATLVKLYPLALYPLYLRRIPIYRHAAFLLVLLLGALPFIGAGQQLLSGTGNYLEVVRFNPGFYLIPEWIGNVLGHPEWVRWAVGVLSVLVAGWLYITDDGTHAAILRRAFYLALPPILLGPVVRPWYVLWLIPFLALVHRRYPFRFALLYLSGSVILGYLADVDGNLPLWLTLLEFGPVGILGIWGLWSRRRSWRPRGPYGALASAAAGATEEDNDQRDATSSSP